MVKTRQHDDPFIRDPLIRSPHDFVVELRREEGGPLLLREPVAPQYLRPLAEDAIWRAQRRGLVGPDRSDAFCEIEPVYQENTPLTKTGKGKAPIRPATPNQPSRERPSARSRHRPVEQLRLHVVRDGAHANGGGPTDGRRVLSRAYPLEIFADAKKAALVRALADKLLDAEDRYDTAVYAVESQPSVRSGTALSAKLTVKQTPLTWLPGRLRDYRERSTQLGEIPPDPDDTQVFILRGAFESARAFCRAGGKREGGAMLVGRLFRQVEPAPDLFTVIEAAFEARHADQQVFSLSLSTETLVHFERQIERRRRRLDRPEEIELGFSHGHNFLPAVDAKTSEPVCLECAKRTTCNLDSAFFSADDIRFQKAFFNKRAFAVALVFGLTPREEDRVRVYGFADGVLKERSIWLVDEPGSSAAAPTSASESSDLSRGS